MTAIQAFLFMAVSIIVAVPVFAAVFAFGNVVYRVVSYRSERMFLAAEEKRSMRP